VDQQLQALTAHLADAAARNTAVSIADRIRVTKARKREQDTIAELEQIVSDLLSDKSELVLIAQAYDQELVAQKISEAQIEYISTKFVPLLRQFIESLAASEGRDTAAARQVVDLVQPLLSVETVTVLQLIGFNFRRAIGEPLTELLSRLILSNVQADPSLQLEVQRLGAVRDNTFLEIAQDPDAYERLVNMQGQRATQGFDA
jgi:hypothetical protein